MIGLLKLELAKLRPARYFKVLFILWLVGFLLIPIGTQSLLIFIASEVEAPENLRITSDIWPIFDFVDIWQNLGSVYRYLTIFLGIMIVISVTNEYQYKTIRQNVLDGLSKREYLTSKIAFAAWIALVAAGLVLILGLILGFIFSPVKDIGSILSHMGFVPAYALHVFHYLLFCMTLAFLIKRSGLTIALILFWTFIFDGSLNLWFLGEGWGWARYLLPTESAWRTIPSGLQRMAMMEVEDYVNWKSIGASLAWCGFFVWAMWKLLSKRDLT